jgi:hypothetical protein
MRWMVLFTLLILGVFHAPLLRAFQQGLVFDQTVGVTDYTVVMFGDKASLDMAQQRWEQHLTKQLIILQMHIPRTVELGLAPRLGDVATQELVKAGVASDVIATHTTHTNTTHAAFRKLAAELPNDATVAVLCPHDRSRYLHLVITAALEPEVQSRWSVCSVPVYGYQESQWWRDREGWKRVSSAWLRQFHLLICGEPPAFQAWNPDEYERSLAVMK